MPLDEFTDKAYAGLAAGKEQVPVGMADVQFNRFEVERQKAFQDIVQMQKTMD